MTQGLAARLLAIGLVVIGSVVVGGGPASAGGGSTMQGVLDRYEAGQPVDLVGYVGPGAQGWVEDGPFSAWLRTRPNDATAVPPGVDPGDVALGPLTVVATGSAGYLALRISLAFALPSDLTPGHYTVVYASESGDGIGDLIGGTVWVGVDPPEPIYRYWPLDDPAWAVRARAGLPATDPALPTFTPATKTPDAQSHRITAARAEPSTSDSWTDPAVPALIGAMLLTVMAAGLATVTHGRRRRADASASR